jgi:hypothetical protein
MTGPVAVVSAAGTHTELSVVLAMAVVEPCQVWEK